MHGYPRTARAILKWQGKLAVFAAIICAPFGWDAALASLAGSVIAIVPTALAAWRVYVALTRVGARNPRDFVRLVQRAQLLRQVLTLLLLAMVMAQAAEHFVPIMTGFVMCLAAYWLVASSRGHRT